MSIETFMNCLEASIDDLAKGNRDIHFNDTKNQFIKFGKDKCEVIYKGMSHQSNLIGTVISNKSVDCSNAVFYFEVTINKFGNKKGNISIGFCESDFQQTSEIGQTKYSYCLKSDGKTYNNKSSGIDFCQKLEEKDTIGCGMLFSNKTIFYTLNGRFINTAFTNIDLETVKYHAAISFGNAQFTIFANFGNKGFKFGIEDMLSNHYKDLYEEINKIDVDSKEVFDLVHEYLIHSGYIGTLRAFEDDSSFSLIHNSNKEEDKEYEKQNSLLKDTDFIAPRKNTLNPDLIASTPLKGNKEMTIKEEKKNEASQCKEEVKETPSHHSNMLVDNDNINTEAPVKNEIRIEDKTPDQEMLGSYPEEADMKVDPALAQESEIAESHNRGHHTKNMLLITDDVGKAKPSTRKLPGDNFAYGKADYQDVEGASDVISNWKFHDQSKKSKPDRDFTKLNKMSVKGKACTAKETYNFRKSNDARMKESSGMPNKVNKLPPEEFTYGMPCRPSTPIRDVIGNFFGEMAESEMNLKYQQTLSSFKDNGLPTEAKHTLKSKIAHEYIKSKGSEDDKIVKLMSGAKDLFKIKRFNNVKPRTDTNNKSKMFQKTSEAK